MKNFQIYLAGGMGKFGKEKFHDSNVWRVYCKNALNEYECKKYSLNIINPNDYFNFTQEPPLYKTQREVMDFDLYKVRSSDLIIVNFNDPQSLGTMAELAIAYDRRIPVVGINTKNQNLHPWQIEMCNRIFDDINDMLDYVEDFYLN